GYRIITQKLLSKHAIAYVLKKKNLAEWLTTMDVYFPSWRIYVLAYFLGGFIIALFLIFSGKSKQFPLPRISVQQEGKVEKPAMEQTTLSFEAEKEFLRKVAKMLGSDKTVLLHYEHDQFKPILEKRGELFIRGDRIKIPKIFSKKISLEKPILSISQKQGLFPILDNGILIGSLYAESKENPLNPRSDTINHLLSQYASKIRIRTIYEKAVYDEESSLFSYPAFYFSLREKVSGKIPFYTIAFQIPKTDEEKLKRVGFEVKNLFSDEQKFLPARISDYTFGILIPGSYAYEEVTKLCAELEKVLSKHYNSHSFYGIIIPPDTSVETHSAYLKRIETGIREAVANRFWGVWMEQTFRPVA
ncbi:MAG: hypothetical protein D6767_00555, partial [Candidatus Hydrogenedentota bacterium]